MPTPFTHLEIAQRLLIDPDVPRAYQQLLSDNLPAFQLGSIVADARVASGIGREVTHFFSYSEPLLEHPWRVMLHHHPALLTPRNTEHRVFLAGYAAHLSTDEAWALKMVRPNFFDREWEGVERMDKFIALHLLLTYMDERDETQLEEWQYSSLLQCVPNKWLPFMPDNVLCSWRDLVAEQIAPDGISQTVPIFSKRLHLEPEVIRTILDNPDSMAQRLWQYVPKTDLAMAEAQTYAYTRDQLCVYLTEFA